MKVLIIHNHYMIPGGEDAVVRDEVALLREKGETVIEWFEDNAKINTALGKMVAAVASVFSFSAYVRLIRLLKAERPDVVHVHNFFPLFSPSVFYACASRGVPVVFTLHNFRILCPTATLAWKGEVTLRSIEVGPWWAVKQRVYRNSIIGSLFVAAMVQFHIKTGTWRKKVTRFIALTEFAKTVFIGAGLPSRRISVKPNFAADPGPSSCLHSGNFLYAGRLTEDKGIAELLTAAQGAPFCINIAGTAAPEVQWMAGPNVKFLGHLSKEILAQEMRRARAVVLPSKWFEGFPRTIVEAYALGVPVIASDIGSLREIVVHGETGLLVPPGDSCGLRRALDLAWRDPSLMRKMGENARQRYLQLYSPDQSYLALMKTYQEAIADNGACDASNAAR